MRSVWSRVGSGSITVVTPGVLRPASRIARLHLGRGDRQAVGDRHRVVGADDGERQPAAVAADEAGAHLLQRLDDAAPSAAGAGGVAGEEGGDRMAGEEAHQQAGRGAGFAEIEHVGRLRRGRRCRRRAPARRRRRSLTMLGAERAHRGGGVAARPRLQQAVDGGFADREGAEHQRAMGNRLVARHADVPDSGPVLADWSGLGAMRLFPL